MQEYLNILFSSYVIFSCAASVWMLWRLGKLEDEVQVLRVALRSVQEAQVTLLNLEIDRQEKRKKAPLYAALPNDKIHP